MECGLYPIITKTELCPGIYDLWLEAPDIAQGALPGQFVDILCEGHPLRRPISLCDADPARGLVRLVFQVRGEGTAWLAHRLVGEFLDILGPLGHGFDLSLTAGAGALFVGGGIGVPPLLFAARRFEGPASAALGFRSASAVLLKDDFETAGMSVLLATDDGTAGFHGLITVPAERLLQKGGIGAVYACGPLPMLKAVKTLAKQYSVHCQLSMEQRMACGMGACLCCAVAVNERGTHRFRHVCKDGPVFDAEKLDL